MVGHTKRYVPMLVRLRELLDGELGSPDYVLHQYPDPGKSPRDWSWDDDNGGGPLLDNWVHATDVLLFLLGDVERVYAEGDNFFTPERRPQIDCAVATLRFTSGAIANIGGGTFSMSSFRDEGVLAATQKAVAELTGPFNNPNRLRYAFRSAPQRVYSEGVEGADPFRLELEHFIDCVRTGKTPRSDPESGMKAVAVCRAIKASVARREPVQLAEIMAS